MIDESCRHREYRTTRARARHHAHVMHPFIASHASMCYKHADIIEVHCDPMRLCPTRRPRKLAIQREEVGQVQGQPGASGGPRTRLQARVSLPRNACAEGAPSRAEARPLSMGSHDLSSPAACRRVPGGSACPRVDRRGEHLHLRCECGSRRDLQRDPQPNVMQRHGPLPASCMVVQLFSVPLQRSIFYRLNGLEKAQHCASECFYLFNYDLFKPKSAANRPQTLEKS